MDGNDGRWSRVSALLHGESGQALTEYALVIALLAVVATAVTAATGVGPAIISHISAAITSVTP
jgi:Flp pilus assembly pilin Flp